MPFRIIDHEGRVVDVDPSDVDQAQNQSIADLIGRVAEVELQLNALLDPMGAADDGPVTIDGDASEITHTINGVPIL